MNQALHHRDNKASTSHAHTIYINTLSDVLPVGAFESVLCFVALTFTSTVVHLRPETWMSGTTNTAPES